MSDDRMTSGLYESSEEDKNRRAERETASEHPRYGRTPSDWGIVEIRDIADVVGGSTPSTAEEDFWNGNIAWATPTDVTSLSGNTIEGTSKYLTEEGLKSSSTHLLPTRSVLMTSRATIGECAVTKVPMATNQGFQSLVPGEGMNSWYLLYAVSHIAPYLESLGSGSTFDEVSKSTVERVEILFPPHNEQRKIASVLYTVDELIQRAEEAEGQNRELKKGLMQELFTEGYYDHDLETIRLGPKKTKKPKSWSVVTLGELAEYQNGYGFSKEQWSDSGRPIIRIQDLTGSAGAETNFFRGEVDERYEVHPGDFLVSWSATLGVFRWSGPEAVLNQHIFKVENISDGVDRDFLYYVLEKSLGLLRRKIHGTTMQHITRSAFENTPVVLPDMEEQKRIGQLLRRVDDKIDAEAEYTEKLRCLKKGLMQDVLTGEVRTDNVDIEIPEEVAAYG